jgi:hypothetical protein
MAAIFEHDCNNCKYLGDFTYDAIGLGTMVVDLYFCPNSLLGGSYIARHGDDGPEYASCPQDILKTNLDRYTNGPHSSYSPGIYEAYVRNENAV